MLLDDDGEVVTPTARPTSSAAERSRERRPRTSADSGRAAERASKRLRGLRAPADSEDAEARREAGLSESPTAIDSEPEEEPASADGGPPADASREADGDAIQSKPRRRGRRGGRRRSAAKAKATPE